jgi:hypothetical protein
MLSGGAHTMFIFCAEIEYTSIPRTALKHSYSYKNPNITVIMRFYQQLLDVCRKILKGFVSRIEGRIKISTR